MSKIKPYMTNEEVNVALTEFGDVGYDDLPSWLKHELIARGLQFPKREPTDLERWETIMDATEHRIMNKELAIEDYINHYTGKRNYNNVF